MMVRSFLTVGSAFVIFVFAFVAIAITLGYLYFPEFTKFFFELDVETQQQIMKDDPSKAIPRTMFLGLLGLVSAACFLIGAYVYWAAPFSRYSHVIFFAVLLLVYHLQMANADPAGKKTMTLIYLFVFPIAVLIGGKFAESRLKLATIDATDLDELDQTSA
jgi:hypothetical protein